jgi:hypothetical protein
LSNRPKSSLPDVTLVAVTSVALQPTVEALEASMRQIDFGEVLLLSDQRPSSLPGGINWRRIQRLNSRADYSRFMLHELVDHVATSHALCVQWDGFVLDGSRWDSRFQDYDYIGAVWPQFADGYQVGNGGFSLRSLRLLRACRELPFDGSQAEDIIICRLNRDTLEKQGIRFAPQPLARQFSFERTSPSGDEFGFHGAFNLVRLQEPKDALPIFKSLEPRMLERSERLELLRWAIRRVQLQFAWEMLRRLI